MAYCNGPLPLSQVSILDRTLLVLVVEEKKHNHLDVVLTANILYSFQAPPFPLHGGQPQGKGDDMMWGLASIF